MFLTFWYLYESAVPALEGPSPLKTGNFFLHFSFLGAIITITFNFSLIQEFAIQVICILYFSNCLLFKRCIILFINAFNSVYRSELGQAVPDLSLYIQCKRLSQPLWNSLLYLNRSVCVTRIWIIISWELYKHCLTRMSSKGWWK